MLDNSSNPLGLSADVREDAVAVHTSATTGPARSLEAATAAALTSLVRTADERDLELDVLTLTTRHKVIRGFTGSVTMVQAAATAYPAT